MNSDDDLDPVATAPGSDTNAPASNTLLISESSGVDYNRESLFSVLNKLEHVWKSKLRDP